jgi:hypothetical protein
MVRRYASSVMGWQWAGKSIVITSIHLSRDLRHAALSRRNNELCRRYEVMSVMAPGIPALIVVHIGRHFTLGVALGV